MVENFISENEVKFVISMHKDGDDDFTDFLFISFLYLMEIHVKININTHIVSRQTITIKGHNQKYDLYDL